ncbi:disease resistance protein RPV1 [Eucalyptus grandis]|uniref:disease resistance protein RPV1 n=1 Tax=Eucalyptus grandis TaxID=71139 RepID=UPI00192EFB53|nr:disease resistance protein RPV1 [Eucalyptus grandis]
MASSSSKPRGNYDVFMSFRGVNVRNHFLGHLYTALDQRGIYTYCDSEELRKGESISPALIKAIKDAHIAIVIFSQDYASSRWCLEELANIMEWQERGDLIALPLFYKVEPREVRTPRKNYRRAMAKHEYRFGKDSEEVQRWKKALLDAGSLSGWHYQDDRSEVDLVKSVVEEICRLLQRTSLHVATHPVGLRPQVVKLVPMLNLESEDVLLIGFWGYGGVGKTTLAKALYNAIFMKFENSYFLGNVREASKDSKDLVSLQKKLLFGLLRKKFGGFSVDRGITLIKERLCRKKVLLVLDDVNDVNSLRVLAGEREWFGKGSRIIITTRDYHLLIGQEIHRDHIYEVKNLEHPEALELFKKHAFLRNNKIVIRRDLVDRALGYAKGHPLALEVLGSFLRGRGEDKWKSALKQLAKSPPKSINDVLKLSYDGLENYTKEIFLDIACFFKGRSTKYVKEVLNSCNFNTTIGIQVLVEKALIIEDGENLQMHDLIQSMGMNIVNEECHDDPGRRSRLWLYDDVNDVLSGDMGTNAVKAIVLDLPKTKAIYIGHNAFKNMRRLRVLIMINVHNSFQGPICLPNELRCFEWPEYPWIPEFFSGPKKLVQLDMPKSNVQVAREQFKGFEQLKFINFSQCRSLISMPDLSYTPHLKKLNLSWCENLERAHESVAYHDKLSWLSLEGCSKFHHLPNVLKSKNLQHLNLTGCSNLRRFSHIPDEINLQELLLGQTSIKELPESIKNLVSLEHMDLTACKELAILPSGVFTLRNLETLILAFSKIKFPKEEDSSDRHTKREFPNLRSLDLTEWNPSGGFRENSSCFPILTYLIVSGNIMTTNLPTFARINNMPRLNFSICQHLREIFKIPRQSDVDPVDLSSCHKLIHYGFTMNDVFKLEQFHSITDCQFLQPGAEMPKWLIPNKDGYISFTASKDLYKKFLSLAFCVVFRNERKENVKFELLAHVNGEKTMEGSTTFNSLDLDHVWLECRKPKLIWGRGAFGQTDWGHFQFSITASSGAIVKNCGFRLLCKSLENDLDVWLQDDQLLDPALLYEIWHEDSQTSMEEESSSETEDILDSETKPEQRNLVRKGLNMDDFSIQVSLSLSLSLSLYVRVCACTRMQKWNSRQTNKSNIK